MKTEIFLLSFFSHLLLTTQSNDTTESNTNVTIIDGTSLNSTIKQVTAGKPIVIHTQIQYYDQPTLRDYQECFENLQKCKTVCEGVENPLECVKQCPVCPLLIKEEIVVQGVNDTGYRPTSTPPLNMTNIIRLTNEIHNIIESQRGNISYNNQNMVHVFQNVSRVGGEFGLGYNNTDPCCIILSSTKSCDTKRFSTSARCHRKRHRVCSRKCKSRIMQAKRITVCEKVSSEDENEDYIDENCYDTVKYVPYYRQKRLRIRPRHKCAPIPFWPYVKCGHSNVHYRDSICRRCQSLTYHYVLRRGVPTQCSRCFMSHASPNYDNYPMWWQQSSMSSNINYGIDYDDFDLETSDWRQDRTLCRLPNGEISENCSDKGDVITGFPMRTTNPSKDTWVGVMPEAQDEYILQSLDDIDDNYYDDNYERISRKRRYIFTPSKYSRRHR